MKFIEQLQYLKDQYRIEEIAEDLVVIGKRYVFCIVYPIEDKYHLIRRNDLEHNYETPITYDNVQQLLDDIPNHFII